MKRRHLWIGVGSFLVTLVLILTLLLPVFDKRFFAAAQVYGLMSDTVISTYEYDPEEGFYPNAIKLSSDGEYSYYAIVSTGDIGSENDGYIRTVKVNESTGVITSSLIDSLEYDISDGYGPSICKVGDGMYAICYCDAGASRQTLVTVSISDVGVIPAAVTETLQLALDGIDALSVSDILSVFDDTYVVAYTDVDGDGQLVTINITDAGDIAAAVTDTEEFDTSNGYFPRMCTVDNDTIALVYETTDTAAGSATARDGMLMTYNITYGLITDIPADSWEFNGYIGRWPDIIHVSDDTYVIACEGAANDGFVNSTSITSTGDLSGTSIDYIEFDTSDAGFQVLFEVGNNSARNRKVFGVSYQGAAGDGFIRTIQVDRNGNMPSTTYTDSLEFDTTDNLWYAPVLLVDDFFFVVVNTGTGNDGFIRSFQLYVNYPPIISDEEPADESVDVSTVPTLSVNISDIGDIVNVTWTTNSTGSWGTMGTNASVYTYGALNDVTNYWEFDGQEGYYPDIIRLGESTYYAIACTGDIGSENDGYIRVVQAWTNNQTIKTALIDSYEYDASDGFWPQIRHVSGDIYAIAYYDDTANLVRVVTTEIDDADGDCTGTIIDTMNMSYDTVNTYPLDFMQVTDNVWVVAYTEITTVDGWIETIWINSTGTINGTLLNSEEFNETYALHPRMELVDSNTIAIVYYDTASDGYISTYNISSNGVIEDTRADIKEYDTGTGTQSDIVKVLGNMFAVIYLGTDGDGFVCTQYIHDTGEILGVNNTKNDTLEFDIADGGYQRLYNLGNDMFVVIYQGVGDDGWVKTFSITSSGVILDFYYDELEFDTTDCIIYPSMVSMGNNSCYLMAYPGNGNDGFVNLLRIGNQTSITLRQINSSISGDGKIYWWNVTVNEYYGVNNVSETYSFTTGAVWYHNTGDNSYFTIGDLLWSLIEIDVEYVMFNTTDFKVVGENRTNVTVHFINTSIIGAGVGDLLLDFSADNSGDETIHFNISGFDPGLIYDIERDSDVFDTDTANVSGDIQFSDVLSGVEYRYTIYLSGGGGASWHVINASINGSIKNVTRWKSVFPPCEVNGSIKNISAWRVISSTINGSIKNVSVWHVINSMMNGSIKNITRWHSIMPPCEVNGSIKNITAWRIISSSINGSIKNITSDWPVSITLYGLTDEWNITWNGTIPTGSTSVHRVFCNNSGIEYETMSLIIAVNSTTWIDEIKFWGAWLNNTVFNKQIYRDNITVLVSTTNVTYGILQDNVGSGMGRYPHTMGYLTWNSSTSPPGHNPFTYVPGKGWTIPSNTTLYARFMLNITDTAYRGTYNNLSGVDCQVSIGNNSGGLGPGILDVAHYTEQAIIEPIWRGVTPICEVNGSIKNITTWIVISSTINGSIKNVTFWHEITAAINGSIKNITVWRGIVPPCEINGSIKNVSSWIIISSSINGSIKNVTVWHEISATINGSIKNLTTWRGIVPPCEINGSIKNVSSWIIISSSINGSIKNITMSAVSPFNPNLRMCNPNPANGTHLTEATGYGVGGNYIKRDTSGLTTSMDIWYQNFTTPPALIPGNYNVTINSTKFTNTPTTWNTSTVYNWVWDNATGGIAPSGPLYVGQLNAAGDYSIFRSFLRFDTSVIPDDAVITSAYVKLIVWQDFSTTDFNVTLLSTKPPKPHNPLIPTDYSRSGIGTISLGQENTTGYTNDDIFNITIKPVGLITIDKTFYTNFSVRSHKDQNQTTPGGNEWITFYGNGMPIANYPKLIINYTIPSSNWQHIVNLTFYTNESGVWTPYNTTWVQSNGTVTIPAPMFDSASPYWWNVSYNSNHTNYGNSSYWEFETVSGSGVVMVGSQQTNSIVIGGPLLLAGVVVGLIFNRRRRKRKDDGEP